MRSSKDHEAVVLLYNETSIRSHKLETYIFAVYPDSTIVLVDSPTTYWYHLQYRTGRLPELHFRVIWGQTCPPILNISTPPPRRDDRELHTWYGTGMVRQWWEATVQYK